MRSPEGRRASGLRGEGGPRGRRRGNAVTFARRRTGASREPQPAEQSAPSSSQPLRSVREDKRQQNRNLQYRDHWVHCTTPILKPDSQRPEGARLGACMLLRPLEAQSSSAVTYFIGRSAGIRTCFTAGDLPDGIWLGLSSLGSENNSVSHPIVKSRKSRVLLIT